MNFDELLYERCVNVEDPASTMKGAHSFDSISKLHELSSQVWSPCLVSVRASWAAGGPGTPTMIQATPPSFLESLRVGVMEQLIFHVKWRFMGGRNFGMTEPGG